MPTIPSLVDAKPNARGMIVRLIAAALLLSCAGGSCWADQWSEADGLHLVFPDSWTRDDVHETGSAGTVILQRKNSTGSVVVQVVKSAVPRGLKGLDKKGLLDGLVKVGATLTSYQEAQDVHKARVAILSSHAASGLVLNMHFLWNDRALYKVTYAYPATVDPAEWTGLAASEAIDVLEAPAPAAATGDGQAWSVGLIQIGIYVLIGAFIVAFLIKRKPG